MIFLILVEPGKKQKPEVCALEIDLRASGKANNLREAQTKLFDKPEHYQCFCHSDFQNILLHQESMLCYDRYLCSRLSSDE